MAVKIRAKQSLSGEYGKLRAGETGYCKPSTAKQLVEWGMAEIVEENVEAPVKKIREHIFAKGYESSKQRTGPVLTNPIVKEDIPSFIEGGTMPSGPVLMGEIGPELSDEFLAKIKGEGNKEPVIPEPEKVASKKEITEEDKEKKEQKEAPKKQYK